MAIGVGGECLFVWPSQNTHNRIACANYFRGHVDLDLGMRRAWV